GCGLHELFAPKGLVVRMLACRSGRWLGASRSSDASLRRSTVPRRPGSSWSGRRASARPGWRPRHSPWRGRAARPSSGRWRPRRRPASRSVRSRRGRESLAVVAVGGEVDGPTARQLWELSRGNALFLRELVVGALEEGTLRRSGELWRAQGPLGRSTRLTEVIQARLGRLADDV